jgi:FkbM family methyltransferase
VVLRGSYDVPGLVFDKPPTILDIGGHVGSATVRFAHVYPGATIHTYEPSPENASFARTNVAGLATLHEVAVVGPGHPDVLTLHEGKNNTGQRSIYVMGEQQAVGVQVKTMVASDLPPCDILKCDSEGCELEVLRAYRHLPGVKAILLEWHSLKDYEELLRWVPTLGFDLVRDDAKGQWIADRNLIFVRREVAKTVNVDPSGIFRCPRSSLDMIAGLYGEYDLGSMPNLAAPVVLDVGGHVGGFAWYALKRWPDARVTSFEPHPETFALLKGNVAGLPVDARHAAVVHPRSTPTMRLYEGRSGRHECSLRDDVLWPRAAGDPNPACSQLLDKWVDVPTFDAAELGPCDVMKVDTEGNEIPILSGYRHLGGVRVLCVEPHAVGGDIESQKSQIRRLAMNAGLSEMGGHILRFARR